MPSFDTFLLSNRYQQYLSHLLHVWIFAYYFAFIYGKLVGACSSWSLFLRHDLFFSNSSLEKTLGTWTHPTVHSPEITQVSWRFGKIATPRWNESHKNPCEWHRVDERVTSPAKGQLPRRIFLRKKLGVLFCDKWWATTKTWGSRSLESVPGVFKGGFMWTESVWFVDAGFCVLRVWDGKRLKQRYRPWFNIGRVEFSCNEVTWNFSICFKSEWIWETWSTCSSWFFSRNLGPTGKILPWNFWM